MLTSLPEDVTRRIVDYVVSYTVSRLNLRQAHECAMNVSLSCKTMSVFTNEEWWRRMTRHHFPCVTTYEGLGFRFGWRNVFQGHLDAFNSNRKHYRPSSRPRISGDVLIVVMVRGGDAVLMYGCTRMGVDTHRATEDVFVLMRHHDPTRRLFLENMIVDTFAISWKNGKIVRILNSPCKLLKYDDHMYMTFDKDVYEETGSSRFRPRFYVLLDETTSRAAIRYTVWRFPSQNKLMYQALMNRLSDCIF